jgi:hypothetical protein
MSCVQAGEWRKVLTPDAPTGKSLELSSPGTLLATERSQTKIKLPDIALCCFYLATRLQTIQHREIYLFFGQDDAGKIKRQGNT